MKKVGWFLCYNCHEHGKMAGHCDRNCEYSLKLKSETCANCQRQIKRGYIIYLRED